MAVLRTLQSEQAQQFSEEAQQKGLCHVHELESRLSGLPSELEAGLGPGRIAKLLGESLRQHFLDSGIPIRDPAPYNAILAAIAGGETNFNGIQQLIGVERGALSGSLRTLLELGWIRREFPFGESSERRGLYRVADPFLTFWYRFVAPLASALQFSDPTTVYAAHVAPRLSEYMGWSVFEMICGQWLQRNAQQRLGLNVRQMGRCWSRDGRTEIDLMAELDDETFLFGECKWRTERLTRLSDLSVLPNCVEWPAV
jgi:AAA+ ATPase superfamily predicted ATPase